MQNKPLLKMNSQKVMELVCDTTFRTLVREEKSLKMYIIKNNTKVVQEAVKLIQYLDKKQIVCTTNTIEHNYNNVLHKIFFNS